MNDVDVSKVADFIQVVGSIGGFVALVVVLWLKGTFVTKSDYEADRKTDALAAGALHGRIQLIDTALVRIEASLKAIPEVQELHRLALALERLAGTVTALDAKLGGFEDLLTRVETMVNRHEEHLLENTRK